MNSKNVRRDIVQCKIGSYSRNSIRCLKMRDTMHGQTHTKFTLGNDSMSDSKQECSYELGSEFERLRSYGYFLIPVHALM